MMIVGIDPGMTGGIAIRESGGIILEPMPIRDEFIWLEDLQHILWPHRHSIVMTYLEMQSIRPMQSGQFKIGRSFGQIEALLRLLMIPVTIVRPQEWSPKYDHQVVEKVLSKRYALIKKARAKIAQELYPGIDMKRTPQCKGPDSGLVDALLIADFGWHKHKPWKESNDR